MDTAVHGGLDERADVLVFDGALTANFVEAAAVGAVAHGLVLEVAFTALVADGAVEGVVCEEEFHYAFTSFVDEGRIGFDDHAFLDGPIQWVVSECFNCDCW